VILGRRFYSIGCTPKQSFSYGDTWISTIVTVVKKHTHKFETPYKTNEISTFHLPKSFPITKKTKNIYKTFKKTKKPPPRYGGRTPYRLICLGAGGGPLGGGRQIIMIASHSASQDIGHPVGVGWVMIF
jgi:hypothetical protein